MTGRIGLRLNVAKRVPPAVAAMAALAAPIVVGMLSISSQASAQSAPTANLEFEVASVKPCGEPGATGRGGPGGRGGGGGGVPIPSPGRLQLTCTTVRQLIRQAILQFANGQRNPGFMWAVAIEGGPSWIDADRYEVNATANPNVSQEMMRGPLLQALLEDRFKLRVHRETREVPVYALTVAKGGPTLHGVEQGSCVPVDLTRPARPALITADGKISFPDGGDQRMTCGTVGVLARGIQAFGMSLGDFSKFLTNGLGRPVIDRTGIAGIFDFRVDFDQTSAQFLPPGFLRNGQAGADAPSDPSGLPSFFTALQEQLGLKLEPARGPGEFLVIDHVERPSAN